MDGLRLRILRVTTGILLFALTIALVGCSSNANMNGETQEKHLSTSQSLISVENVQSLEVVGALPNSKGSPLFTKANEQGIDVITKVTGWLNSAKPVTDEVDYVYEKHGYPMVINIKKDDNQVITVEPAYNCNTTTNTDGSISKTCEPIEGDVQIVKESKMIVLKSFELYEWLKEGWKHES